MSLAADPVRAAIAGLAQPRADTGRTLGIGMIASLALPAVFLVWAQLTPIAGAVISPGQAVVPGKPSLVQSLEGGAVERILVANGDRVAAGEVLLELDPTLVEVKLDVAMGRLATALALRARLEAEQAGLAAPLPVADLPAVARLPFALPDTALAEAGQAEIFAARAALRRGRLDLLAEREAQFVNQTAGFDAQIAAREEQLALLERELGNIEQLFAKGMVRESQLLDLQRSRAGLMGDIAESRSERARLGNAARDAVLEAGQADRAFLEEVATDLRAAITEIEERTLEIVSLTDAQDRLAIRAPVAGVIHEMQVTTLGGVIAPGAPILQVVPQTGTVEFEIRVPAKDLERVHVGQGADLVLSTLDPRTTPRLVATVASVSPAAITDPATGQGFYRLMLDVAPSELDRLGEVDILPGMPVDAYLHTGERTVMSYLLAPLTVQLMQAFRE
jgi:HlyD family secretion protein